MQLYIDIIDMYNDYHFRIVPILAPLSTTMPPSLLKVLRFKAKLQPLYAWPAFFADPTK